MAQIYEYFSLWFKSINSIRSGRNKKFLIDYAHKHKIYILCYKSIENEVLRFFIENERLAQNLCLYTLQPLHVLTDEFQEVVDYLKNTEQSILLLIILPTPFIDQIICFL